MKRDLGRASALFIWALGLSCALHGQEAASRVEHMLVIRGSTLYAMEGSGTNRRKIADNVIAAALSHDGTLVAFGDSHGMKVFDLNSSKTSTLVGLPSQDVRDITWSPSDAFIAYSKTISDKGEFLHIVSYPPSGPPRVTGPTYGGMSFSKDGNFILHASATGGRGALEKTAVQSGKTETLFSSKTLIEKVSYSADNSEIAFLLVDKEPDSSSDEPDCSPPGVSLWILPAHSGIPAKVGLKRFGDPDIDVFSWSPKDNLLVFDSGRQQCDFPGDRGDIYVVSPDLKTAFKLSQQTLSRSPVFSPDGQRVLFANFTRYSETLQPDWMIANLKTHAVKPFTVQEPADQGDRLSFDLIVDWK